MRDCRSDPFLLRPVRENYSALYTLAGFLIAIGFAGVFVLYAIHTLFTTFPMTREIWEVVWPWIKKAVTFLFSFRFF